MDRRSFLRSLLAVGACATLPRQIARASDQEFDQAWAQLQAEPVVFGVEEGGTLWMPSAHNALVRREAFELEINPRMTAQQLIFELRRCTRATDYLCAKAAEDWEQADSQSGAAAKRRARSLSKALGGEPLNGDGDWESWLLWKGKVGELDEARATLDQWLDAELDWDDYEFLPRGYGQQGAAVSFFEEHTAADLAELGVVIVEGDHPGSSYYGAEMRGDIEEANERARRLGWPIVFKYDSRY